MLSCPEADFVIWYHLEGRCIYLSTDQNNLRLAVLIDADNVPRDSLKYAMDEIAIYGTPTIKRIYGDWTSPNIGGWKQSLLENAVTPIQQYSYTTGKNSTDSAMIIDAMDILYSGQCDGFVLVSSDSDFTRLAIRLREAGRYVIGMGEKKTPNPFIVACDKFIYIEVLREREKKAEAAAAAKKKKAETQKKAEPAKASSKSGKSSEKTPDRLLPDKFVPDEIEQLIADSIADISHQTKTPIANLILYSELLESEQLPEEARANVVCCDVCGGFTTRDQNPCPRCSDSSRDATTLCIVEEPGDIASIERAGAFNGLYHALHGKVSASRGTGPGDLRLEALSRRLAEGNFREVILATGTDLDGDATAEFLSSLIRSAAPSARVTRIAFGLPVDSGIAYSDPLTLKRALAGRR